jgi:hypothetical protein
MSALDDPERLGAFTGELLEAHDDPELHAIVTEAARMSGYPIALVSLVLRRTQFIRAQVGMPRELAISRATDRCSSFCQYVVSSNAPFEVTGAQNDQRVSQTLVEKYGIRAYLGLPLTVGGQTLGALCVIDTKDNQVSDAARAALGVLAQRATARLGELQKQRAASQAVAYAAQPVFGELRNLLLSVFSAPELLRVALADLAPLLRVVRGAKAGLIPPDKMLHAIDVLEQAECAQADISTLTSMLEDAAQKLGLSIQALENTIAASEEGVSLAGAIHAATRTALHATKLIGGTHWGPIPSGLRVRSLGSPPGVALAVALHALCERCPGRCAGIDLRVHAGEHDVKVELDAGLEPAASESLVADMNDLFGRGSTTPAAGGIALCFARA